MIFLGHANKILTYEKFNNPLPTNPNWQRSLLIYKKTVVRRRRILAVDKAMELPG